MKLFFLDFDFHKRTGSSAFFVDLLKSRFNVKMHYAHHPQAPEMCKADDVADSDVLVYWQMTPSNFRAMRFGKPTIYIPMYDSETFNPWKWRMRALTGAKVISFCEEATRRLKAFGLDVLTVKYVPESLGFHPGDPRKLFLWDRGGVSFDQLKESFDLSYFSTISIRGSAQTAPRISVEDIARYHVTVIPNAQLSNREDYYALFKDFGVFVAPRAREGIGLSFIEAMSMGKCVIARNDATMNEYIHHLQNGLLMDGTRQEVLSEESVQRMQKQAYVDCDDWRDAWKRDHERILDFIETAAHSYQRMRLFNLVRWWFYLPLQYLWSLRNLRSWLHSLKWR